MKIKIEIIPELVETEITIQAKEMTDEIKNIERFISLYYVSLSVKKDQRNFNISPQEIYYIDAVDHDVFVYTKNDVYETSYKLYQLEEMYPSILLRVNKNTLINHKMIHSFKSSINGRMEAELKNKDRIIISRMYVPKLKALLKGDNI
ncbi:MAG: LytTR family transcriptional regulator DNA-binding domain-containing protein [Acholeplasmataceae bacterium]|nr:LytTR family transcriptional regulator DNA-binding domain-containing protein [Acholeplasmataceae bacterium]